MKFVIVDTEARRLREVEYESLHEAERDAGLDPGEVDHGTVGEGIAIVVYQFGLFEPQRFKHFSIGGQIYAGPAVLYGYNEVGETVSVRAARVERYVRFWGGADEVEAAITAGQVQRPYMAVNGVKSWQWSKEGDNPYTGG